MNEQPNDILLANAYVDENSGRGIAVGNLSARDPDTGQSFSFSLVDDAGGLFMIEKHQIKVAQDNIECLDLGGVHCRINYETRRLINVRVKAEDDGSPALSFEKSIVINVRDINDSPRDIELSANNVTEDAPMGVRIGQFTATDEDGQEITFRLTHDDDGRFNLTDDGFIIKAKDTNYESSNAHKVTVEARDNGRPPLKVRTVYEAKYFTNLICASKLIYCNRFCRTVLSNSAVFHCAVLSNGVMHCSLLY